MPITSDGSPQSESVAPATAFPAKLTSDHLPNPVQIHEKVIAGGLPEGDAAFAELASLGVRTIISVDGAKPDVETARRHGLRYVHLPHGYDGIPERRVQELAKAVRDLEGPVYIHCHHGKHRSPAAASVACVAAGLIDQSFAVPILKLAGTNPGYRGLYESAELVTPLESKLLDELDVEFQEVVAVPPLAEAMVHLGHTWEHLQLLAAAGWVVLPDHPDLDPPHEALLLREHYTELLRTDEVQQLPDDFQQMLRDSESAAAVLEAALTARKSATVTGPVPQAVSDAVALITANCRFCHEQYRDVPLSEK